MFGRFYISYDKADKLPDNEESVSFGEDRVLSGIFFVVLSIGLSDNLLLKKRNRKCKAA